MTEQNDSAQAPSEAMTVEQLAEQITASEQPEVETPDAEPAPDPVEVDPDAADPEVPEAEDPAPEDDLEAVAPPHYWSAEEKEQFAALPREMQELVSAKAQEAVVFSNKAKQEAEETKKHLADEINGVTALKAKLEQAIPAAVDAFTAKWAAYQLTSEEAWAELARNDAPLYTELKAEYDLDLSRLQRAHLAKQEAEKVSQQAYFAAERELLGTIAPDLTDPERGPRIWPELNGFLTNVGFSAEAIKMMGAREASVAYDAMRYRQANAKVKAAVSDPKSAAQAQPAKAKATLRPAAAPPAQSPQKNKEVAMLEKRFANTGSIDDMAALMTAKGI